MRKQSKSTKRLEYLSEVETNRALNRGYTEYREKDLVFIAWQEFRVSAAYSGTADALMGCDEVRPPKWFRDFELNFLCTEQDASFWWYCEHLNEINRNSIHRLGLEAPKRVTYPFNFKDPRHDSLARRLRPHTRKPGQARRGESLSQLLEATLVKWGVNRC